MAIPVVDLADFSGTPQQKASFVAALGKAYEEVGFVAVAHHGISAETIAELYTNTREFFSQPAEIKKKYEIAGLAGQRGYTSFGKEHAKGSNAADLKELISTLGVSSDSISIVGHSMGCFAALEYASQNQVKDVVFIGPPPVPFPQQGAESFLKRADTVRANGMALVAKTVAALGTSQRSKAANPLAVSYVHTLMLANDPEGYAKGCTALAGVAARPINIDCLKISGKRVLLAGDEDSMVPVAKVQDLSRKIGSELQVLNGVGHWHALEDVANVAKVLVDTL